MLPGHYVKIAFRPDGGPPQPIERRYWDFDFPDWGDEDDAADPAALIDEFEATFQSAVEIRLRADVPVVGYLSGGVDSAYVLATAAQGRRPAAAELHHSACPTPNLDEESNARGCGARDRQRRRPWSKRDRALSPRLMPR